jgi:hypothetical protein
MTLKEKLENKHFPLLGLLFSSAALYLFSVLLEDFGLAILHTSDKLGGGYALHFKVCMSEISKCKSSSSED